VVNHSLIGVPQRDSFKGLEDEIRSGIFASLTGKTVSGQQSDLDLITPHR